MTNRESAPETGPRQRTRLDAVRGGLLAALAVALAGAVQPVAASKRTKRIKFARCQAQVEQCRSSLAIICEGDAGCLENLICCDLFADCNAAAGVPCIFANAN